jgi:hypothetical protein
MTRVLCAVGGSTNFTFPQARTVSASNILNKDLAWAKCQDVVRETWKQVEHKPEHRKAYFNKLQDLFYEFKEVNKTSDVMEASIAFPSSQRYRTATVKRKGKY